MVGFSASLTKFAPAALAIAGVLIAGRPAAAADPDFDPKLIDPTPIAQQMPAVDGINFKASLVSGVVGGYANHMLVTSVATPMPYLNQFGAQLDLGIGNYRSDYTSAAAGLHLFWRDPAVGLIGIYGDWGYVNPEHAGRVGIEAALYSGQWSLDALAGVTFGQHVLTQFFDEIDLSYYFTEDFRGSIGHRLTTRGHVANVGFEYALASMSGWSLFGEAEAGEDDYYGAWIGLRYAFGASGQKSLIERDRQSDPIVRIPRNLASVTRCGDIPNPANYHKSWNGFKTEYTSNICGSRQDLADHGAVEGKL
ncbi:MAG: hypothetical protein BroJett030_28940 [Alphaproteobacteria bacterium]|nr:MAG: hypothetical protein BroJett030_28940 [Alphaproteobacteria bacterium]